MLRLFVAVITTAIAMLSLTTSNVTAQPAPVSTALITPADLPGDWIEEPPSDDDDDSASLCGIEASQELGSTIEAGKVTYSQGRLEPVLYQVVSRTPEAGAVMERVRTLPVPCEWSTTDEEGVSTTWTMDVLPFPSFGDETLAFRLNTTLDDIAYLETEMVFIRRGDVVSVVSIASVGVLSPPESQTALLESLVTLVDERLLVVAP
jgi:hypothetical protein